jgi:hypothetical protein
LSDCTDESEGTGSAVVKDAPPKQNGKIALPVYFGVALIGVIGIHRNPIDERFHNWPPELRGAEFRMLVVEAIAKSGAILMSGIISLAAFAAPNSQEDFGAMQGMALSI